MVAFREPQCYNMHGSEYLHMSCLQQARDGRRLLQVGQAAYFRPTAVDNMSDIDPIGMWKLVFVAILMARFGGAGSSLDDKLLMKASSWPRRDCDDLGCSN